MRLPLWLPLILFLAGQACAALSGVAQPPDASGLRRIHLYVMSSDSLFTTVNRSDAIASLRVWITALGKRRGFQFDTKLDIFNSTADALARLKEHSVDVLVLDTPDYLALASSHLLEPMFAGTHRGQLAAFRYLLLERELDGTAQLEKLRGKRIVVNSRTKSELGMEWIEPLLAENRLGRASRFFASTGATHRASSSILPLCFGRIDACVVDSGNGELTKELNPQLARLKVIAQSEPVIEGLIALPVHASPYRGELVDSILELHKDPAGEQMALVFKTGPMIRAGKAAFESVRVLWNRYLRLGSSAERNTATAPLSGAARTPGSFGFAARPPEEAAGKERP
jgi:hypothetical protein